MARPTFKRGTGSGHLRLEHWFYDCAAWKALKPGPRVLYLELKRHFNGGNNGDIFLSQRIASASLGIGRDTVGRYYEALLENGFIVVTKGHCLGPHGIGQSATYALTELPLRGKPATKEFMNWQKQKPRRKIQHSLAGKSNTTCCKNQAMANQRLENTATLGQKAANTVSENPAIYTSNHIPKETLDADKRLALAQTWMRCKQGLCGKALAKAA